MCCLISLMFLFGARLADVIWWIAQPGRWDVAFSSWVWAVLGIIFIPWTTLMWVAVAPNGVYGFDWLWLGLALLLDVSSYGGSAWGNRDRIPGSSRYA
jgi:hypothetical protein